MPVFPFFQFPYNRYYQRYNYNNENYMYNAPMERFAELSGRSLSTFRRECMARFGMPPNKLILGKRLEMAYEKLSHDDVRPSDIY